MAIHPCPKCESPRESLEAECEECGWSPPPMRSTNWPVQQIYRFTLFCKHGFTILFLLAMLHLLLVFWSFYLLPDSFWVMGAAPVQDVRSVVVSYVFLTLNFPVTYLGFLLHNYWNLSPATVYPWIVVNSFVWAATIYGFWRLCVYLFNLKKTIQAR